MVLDHACDIQVFCYDETISIYEFTGGLMMKVKTLIMDLLMKLSKRHSLSFFSVVCKYLEFAIVSPVERTAKL